MTSLPATGALPAVPDRRTLAHAGVADARRVQTLLTSPEFEGRGRASPSSSSSATPPIPDRALLLWVRLAEREPRVHRALRDPETTARLLRLLGASEALGEFLIRRPEHLDLVLDPGRGPPPPRPALRPAPTPARRPGPGAGCVRHLTRRLLLDAVG
ncbi:hypothetical protein GY12_01815, partial [Micrococcus luteus]